MSGIWSWRCSCGGVSTTPETWKRRTADIFTRGRIPVQTLTGGFNNQVFAHDGVCVKLYKLDDRPRLDREWQALTLLADQAPGLAPRPLRRHADRVEMELLPGTSLLDLPSVGRPELAALAEALHRVFAVDAPTHPYETVATVPLQLERLRTWPSCVVPALR